MKTKNDNQMFSRKSNKNSQGFTLVEILVIVAILVLLIGILAPSINNAIVLSKVRKTEAAIAMLSAACKQFETDFGDFPSSDKDDIQLGSDNNIVMDSSVDEGKEIIVVLLTGYPGDVDDSVSPDTSDFYADDGKTGFGFRTVKRGKVYGPYNGAESLNVDGDPPVFQDAFDNDILYYRYDETNDQYQEDHNTGAPPVDPPTAPSDDYLDACATVRTDFLFLSPGPDEEYTTVNSASTDAEKLENLKKIKASDDVTNLE